MNSYGVVKGLKNYDFDQMREEIRKRNEQREEDEENAEFAMSENPYISPSSTRTPLRRKYNSIAYINESRRQAGQMGGKKRSYKKRSYKKRSYKKRSYKKISYRRRRN